MKERDQNCDRCSLSEDLMEQYVCMPGRGQGQILVVLARPASGGFRKDLLRDLAEVGISAGEVRITAVNRCSWADEAASTSDIKTCATEWLLDEVRSWNPEWILGFGNEALKALTGHSGITKHRCKEYPTKIFSESAPGTTMCTISPAAARRNPAQKKSYMADLRYMANRVHGRVTTQEVPPIAMVRNEVQVSKLLELIEKAEIISYDVETVGPHESAPEAAIVSLSATMVVQGKTVVWALPLFHPQSWCERTWRFIVAMVVPSMAQVPKRIAQNGKYDDKWLSHFGKCEIRETFDTMLACHLLDENRRKGLKEQAHDEFGVGDWGIDTSRLLSTPIGTVLQYNAWDTWWTYRLYLLRREELIAEPRLLRIYKLITMPANAQLTTAEMRKVWVDRQRLATNGKIMRDELRELEAKIIAEHGPEGTVEELAEMGWPTTKHKALRLMPANLNPSKFSRWLLFEHLGLPVIEMGKTGPSMAERCMLELRDKHPIVPAMMARIELAHTVSSFFDAYDEVIGEDDRIPTTFKIAGTVTGRLSSGKEDTEKVSARRQVRGVNFQQVPRDKRVRGLFGATPGMLLIEADFSQVELRIAAHIAQEQTMLRLYRSGQDIHRATASWVLGVPESAVTSEDRKKAKAVNFGFLYGMGPRKFVETAFQKYQVVFTLEQAQDIRRVFFQQFSGLQAWHGRQRRLAHANKRVQNPIGRVRHLPDIDSDDEKVVAEAERQAINSPVQSFGSDLCMLSLIYVPRAFAKLGIEGYVVGTVHDSLIFEVKREHVKRALPVIKKVMENLPLKRLFGVELSVPIVVDLKLGTHWGDARELSDQEIQGKIDLVIPS